jgi:hypothetical protein
MSNALTVQDYNAPTAYDAFDHDEPGSSPIRGAEIRFSDGPYVTGKAKTPLELSRHFIALDKAGAWLFLKKDCQPEWVIHTPGTPKPERPACDEATWPIGLSGEPECPWRWCHLLYLMDVDSGETLTFTTSTNGGRIAIDELTQQIKSMRSMRAGAMLVIELQSVMMSTKWGSKRRPSFKIVSWRDRAASSGGDEPPAQLEAPEYDNSREYEEENVF